MDFSGIRRRWDYKRHSVPELASLIPLFPTQHGRAGVMKCRDDDNCTRLTRNSYTRTIPIHTLLLSPSSLGDGLGSSAYAYHFPSSIPPLLPFLSALPSLSVVVNSSITHRRERPSNSSTLHSYNTTTSGANRPSDVYWLKFIAHTGQHH